MLRLDRPLLPLLAAAAIAPFVHSQSQPDTGESSNAPSLGGLGFQADEFTGQFAYSVPISVPPGRQGLSPRLSLDYQHSGMNGPLGVGWALNYDYIERRTDNGVPVVHSGTSAGEVYDGNKGLTFLHLGEAGNLVNVGGSVHMPEFANSRLNYELKLEPGTNKSFWVGTDAAGVKYSFGRTLDSTLSNPDWSGPSAQEYQRVFRWALDSVTDLSGNRIDYQYEIVDGVQYLSSIEYNGNVGSQPIPHLHRVRFIYENGRPDKSISARAGFLATTDRLLEEVVVEEANGNPVRRYKLYYDISSGTGRKRLVDVRSLAGVSGAGWEQNLSFDYQDQQFSFEPVDDWAPVQNPPFSGATASSDWWFAPQYTYADNPPNGSRWTRGELLDIDGNGIPDRVTNRPNASVPQAADLSVQWGSLNALGENEFESFSSFGPMDHLGTFEEERLVTRGEDLYYIGGFPTQNPYHKTLAVLMQDMNRDGKLDRILRPLDKEANYWRVQLNNGLGFDPAMDWPGINTPAGVEKYKYAGPESKVGDDLIVGSLLDMDGDGYPDRVLSTDAPANGSLLVYLGTGSGFDPQPINWDLPAGALQDDYAIQRVLEVGGQNRETRTRLVDINGDGLPDKVRAFAFPSTQFEVWLNLGHGFAPSVMWGGVGGAWRSLAFDEQLGRSADLVDINADGLVDRVLRGQAATFTSWRVQINRGTEFGPVQDWTGVTPATGPDSWSWLSAWNFQGGAVWNAASFRDVNGDSLPDRVLIDPTAGLSSFRVQTSSGPYPDLMSEVSNNLGAVVGVEYESSAGFDNFDAEWTTNPWAEGRRALLHYPVQVVKKVVLGQTPAFNQPAGEISFEYEGGFHNVEENRFGGFHCVRTTDAQGAITTKLFHQGGGRDGAAEGEFEDAPEKAGRPYYSRVEGPNGTLYSESYSQVKSVLVEPEGVYAPYLATSVTRDWNGMSSYRSTVRQQIIDPVTLMPSWQADYGEADVTNLLNYGIVDLKNDALFTHTGYATIPSNLEILDRVLYVARTATATLQHVLESSQYEYSEDGRGLMTASENWLNLEDRWLRREFDYDAYGNQDYAKDELGGESITAFHPVNHIYPVRTTILSSTGNIANSGTYDINSGKQLSRTDVNGHMTRWTYDPLYRLERVEIATEPYAAGPTNEWLTVEELDYTLGSSGGTYSVTVRTTYDGFDLAQGHQEASLFDGFGRVVTSQVETESSYSGSGFRHTSVVYDGAGNPVFQTENSAGSFIYPPLPGTRGVTSEFDVLGRLKKVIPPPSESGSATGVIEHFYGGAGDPWRNTTIDPRGSVKHELLNGRGHAVEVHEVDGSNTYVTTFQHDPLGRIIRVVDEEGQTTSIGFDSLDRRTAVLDTATGLSRFGYDDMDRMLFRIDGLGQRTRNVIDEFGRIEETRYFDASGALAETVKFTFDASDDPAYTVRFGELYKIEDSEGYEKYSYDTHRRLEKATRHLNITGQSYTVLSATDLAGNLKSVTYPDGTRVDNHYDTGGLLVRIEATPLGGTPTPIYTADAFDSKGSIVQVSYGNGAETSRDYYQSGRIQRISTKDSAGAVIQDLAYTYDESGNILSATDAVGQGPANSSLENVLYDDLGRLDSYTRNGSTFGFEYSPTGNLKRNGESGPGLYQYAPGRPSQVVAANGTSFGYDAAGNMTQRGSKVLDYDERNRLVAVTDGAVQTTFGYSYKSDRLWKQQGSDLSIYIGRLFERKDNRDYCHVYAGDQLVCTIQPAALPTAPNPSPTAVADYRHPDHIGSSSVSTGQDGLLSQRTVHSAYGRLLHVENSSGYVSTFQFTGQALDDETGFYFYKSRYYDPELGRFLQADTLIPGTGDPQSLNRYSYARSNPIMYSDPSGHVWTFVAQVAIAAVIGGVGAELQGGDFWEGAKRGAISAVVFAAAGSVLGNAAPAGGTSIEVRVLPNVTGSGITLHISATTTSNALTWGAAARTVASKVALNYVQSTVSQAVGSIAARAGIDPQKFTYALAGISVLGNAVYGSRFFEDSDALRNSANGPGVFAGALERKGIARGLGSDAAILGFGNRGPESIANPGSWFALVADAADVLLAAQGLPTASSVHFAISADRGQRVWGHSLGALDVINLSAAGIAPNARVAGFPGFMPIPHGLEAKALTSDPVFRAIGGWFGGVGSIDYKPGPDWTYAHAFSGYLSFFK